MSSKKISKTEKFSLNTDSERVRIDQLLANRYQNVYSRNFFQDLIKNQCVYINGQPAKKRDIPKAGDLIQVDYPEKEEIRLTPEAMDFSILFEDNDLFAINKPAGLVVHPGAGNHNGTFANGFAHYCGIETFEEGDIRPGIIHRLDKDTTGILIAAKSSTAFLRMSALFANRKVDKQYLAICIGNPGSGEVNAPIARHPADRKKMAIRNESSREARTGYETLVTCEGYSLVLIHLYTGRTHQARVHMAHLGTPILGDPTYGRDRVNSKFNLDRQMLHAWKLSFIHPMNEKEVNIEAPLPEDMQQIMKKLKLER